MMNILSFVMLAALVPKFPGGVAVGNGCEVSLEKGEYHFYAAEAPKLKFRISNHDQPEVRPVLLPFVGVTNVTVNGNGSRFVFHGMGVGVLVQDSRNVTLRNVTIGWERPYFSEGTVVGYDGDRTVLRIDRTKFPYRFVDTSLREWDPAAFPGLSADAWIAFAGEDWQEVPIRGVVFRGDTHEMLEGVSHHFFSGRGRPLGNGDVALDIDLRKVGIGASPGDVFLMRARARPHPAVCIDRATDTLLEDVVIQSAFGMGLIAQCSENVTFRGSGRATDRTAGVFPPEGRVSSSTLDATHFSNCRGRVLVENCWFQGMIDDALNVHDTSFQITFLSGRTVRCRFMHPQAFGYEVFRTGDRVRFIRSRTLEDGPEVAVAAVRRMDEKNLELSLAADVPGGYEVGDALENASAQPDVVFRGNVACRNWANGVLLTTRGRVTVEGNLFDRIAGGVIKFPGDARTWYEAGACRDVTVTNNIFRNCLLGPFAAAIVDACPVVNDLAGQKVRYHRNIRIVGNEFETFDVPLLAARSVSNLVWRANRIVRNDDHRSWKRAPVSVVHCDAVDVEEEPIGPFGDFVRPSQDCRPETWFHLIGGNVAKEGLEADLDAIRAAGIRGIQFFHGQFGGVWPGMENRQIPCLSPKWEEILSFVAENCERKGLSFKMQNCPGWSMSGGPWIRPENAMRNLTYSRTEVTGDGTKSVELALAEPTLPTPENPCDADGRDYRDLFVLAFPTPVGDGDADLVPTEVSDGRFEKALAGQKVDFRPGENPSVELGFAGPVTIRAIELPSERQLNHAFCYDPRLTVRVEAKVGSDWTVVAEQPVPPGNWEDLVPQTIALDERASDRWRLTFLNEKALSIPYLRLRSGARLNNWEALAAWTLRGLVRRPCPRQDSATWVDPGRILDLTEDLGNGTLRWTPPPGKWTVLRIGHVNNGMKNGPAPKEATGWECNKLDPAGIDCNFNAYIGRFADGILKGGRLKGMVVDSWECRRQTWTARMEEEFRARAGYDLRTRLPAVFGYVLGSPDATERFLLDWRRTIGALVEENYYRRFVELGHRKDLHVQYEAAMGDVMPGDVMRFWKWADTPMCEFWSPHDNANGFVGSHDFKPVLPCVSAAHLYGKRRVDAEAFTSMGLKWDETLRMLKGDANRHFARGVTHLVFHTYTHNPRTDWKLPGTSFGHCIGTPFIRGQVWWRFMPEFTDYCARCTTMLERGDNVADVLRYLGDELGHRPSEQAPTLPGYKADYLNTDALMERLSWKDGAFETPEGLRWRVLWVPDCVRLLPSSMARLAELAGQGARIAFDRLPESAATAAEGADAELARQTAAVRKGANVTVGIPLADVVRRMGLEPDVTAERVFWNHRRDERSDWYFIAAEDPAGFAGEVSFRTTGPVELWDAVTGERRPAAARTRNGRTVVALDLARAESAFVVFRPDALPPAAPAKRGAPVALVGPWTLAFPSGWGAPASVEVAALRPLGDLPELDDEAKAFSGTVSYRRGFESDGKPVSLDLGDVASVAEVFVNGRKVRTLWAPPYRCDLSGFTRPGANELRVDVTDTWFNRLAYDAKLPEPSRKTWTIAGPKAGTPLRPFGLLGPVRLLPVGVVGFSRQSRMDFP